MGARVMAWWRARVVAPMRRTCRLAVDAARARVRKAECGVLNLHQDMQTCGYHDVQVMWGMLSSDKEAAAAASAWAKQQRRRKRPFWRLSPSFWPARSPRAAAAQ